MWDLFCCGVGLSSGHVWHQILYVTPATKHQDTAPPWSVRGVQREVSKTAFDQGSDAFEVVGYINFHARWWPSHALQQKLASSRNKLPLMILNRSKLQENGLSCRKMDFPKEKGIFLQKKAFSCRKMHFPAEKCGFRAAHGRKPKEIAGGLQSSRIKNASQLSQDSGH